MKWSRVQDLKEIKGCSRRPSHNTIQYVPNNIRNPRWSAALIINLSEPDLENRLKNKLLALTELEQGSPVVFKLMMDIIFSVIDQALYLFISRIKQMKVTKYVGEDISWITGFVCGAHTILENCDFTPPDMTQIILMSSQLPQTQNL
eukprot:2113258-Ditylum_brightwellii.AAC.1